MKTLQNILHRDIPLSRHMGIEVSDYDGLSLTLEAPLEKNTNHKSTAFGGSLYSLAVLSGWGLLHIKLQEEGLDGQVVIQESRIAYRSPVVETLRACCRTDDESLAAAFHMLRNKGRARIRLEAFIEVRGRVAVEHEGWYFIQA